MLSSTSALVEALRQQRLLEPPQLAELAGDLPVRFPEARGLAQELIRRGWLTPYQINQLLQGRGRDLVLGSYVLLERLGEGGMGLVFKARHTKLGRVVALKLIRQDRLTSDEAVRRFHREIHAVAQLNHPNIVLAYDADEAGGRHFYAMEFVDGTDLARLVKDSGPLPITKSCDYIRQAALGLQHAYERGLVHRDIKPSNLMLTRQGQVKVLDLGLARLDGDAPGSHTLTHENSVMGTPDFVSPEQARNAHTADIRADLYSLGCTLFFLLTGQVPFPGSSLGEKLVKHQLDEPPDIPTLRPDVPENVAAVVRKLMAKRPEDRYETPAALAAALVALPAVAPVTQRLRLVRVLPDAQATPVSSDTLESPGRMGAPPQRSPALWKLLAGAGVLFLGLIGICLALWPRAGTGPRGPRSSERADAPPTLVNSIGMQLVLIPAGKFVMGSPESEEGRKPHEGPQHEVVIARPFYMDAHEVTVGQFRAFVQATGYRTEGERTGAGAFSYSPMGETVLDPKVTWQTPGWTSTDDQPVSAVSRGDALAFCDWLSRKEGKPYRLPTEAEWEYACRAGTATPFPQGSKLPATQAHSNAGAAPASTQMRPRKAGSYPPNAFGLYDMQGNVWEWCADWYDPNYYGQSPREDPPGAAGGTQVVVRGGGFEVGAAECRSAHRFAIEPTFRHVVIGFRVVRLQGENRSADRVWMDDAIPDGARLESDGGDKWNWVTGNPAPYSGSRAHQSSIATGTHQHFFIEARNTVYLGPGDKLYAYVYLDPDFPPAEVMLQWHDTTGSWDHRAYWGSNDILFGADGTDSRRSMGPLPRTGAWVRLEVPAKLVGLEGQTIDGMSFTLYNGGATWDKAGVAFAKPQPVSGQ